MSTADASKGGLRSLLSLKEMSEVERYLFLVVQLAFVLVAMAYVLRDTPFSRRLGPYTQSEGLRTMLAMAFGGFLLHYWLPKRYREPFWWLLSAAGALYIAGPVRGGAMLGITAGFFIIAAAPVPFVLRALALSASTLAVVYVALYQPQLIGKTGGLFTIFGGLFMFRLVAYLVALNRRKDKRPTLVEHLRYFCILPNYVMPHFPIIEFNMMSGCHDRRPRHECAQEGIGRILNAAVQLGIFVELSLAYPAMFSILSPITEFHSQSLADLAWILFTSLLFFLPISGGYHLIIGIMMLFGYDLPRTSNNYALSVSPLDYWHRANIYWMQFLREYLFFPVLARLRKPMGRYAMLVGVASVFFATWLMHLWLRGWLTDMRLFERWTSEHWVYFGLGAACVLEVYVGWIRVALFGHKQPAKTAVGRWSLWAAKVAATSLWMALLTTLLRTTTVSEFLRLLAWWS